MNMTILAQNASDGGAGGAALLIVLAVIFGAALYFLPSICAMVRSVPNVGSVIVLNLFLGWTLVGWVVALAMAFRSRPNDVVIQQYGFSGGYGQSGAGTYPHDTGHQQRYTGGATPLSGPGDGER